MKYHPEEVLKRLMEFAKEIDLEKTVDGVIYREDYQDYQVILDDIFHCELREKLISALMEHSNHADTIREIVYLLRNAFQFEEWEKPVITTDNDDIILE